MQEIKSVKAKISESPREKSLIQIEEKLKESINIQEVSLELDKELLIIVQKKLEKFK